MPVSNTYSLFNNSRFYILMSSILLSIAVVSYVRLTVPSDQLFYIRTQQLFGLLCIFYWYTALIISPLGYAIGKKHLKHIEFARRAIGVSAAYYAVLHAGIALFGQLGGPSGVTTLSPLFQWSLVAGLFGIVVLCLMAVTSFDKVITFMTFRRWKWLHRLVYAGGILAVLHIWSVGTHAGYTWIQITAFIGLVVLAGLEMYRMTILLSRNAKPKWTMERFNAVFLFSWAIWAGLIASIPDLVDTYRSNDAKLLDGLHGDAHKGEKPHEGENH